MSLRKSSFKNSRVSDQVAMVVLKTRKNDSSVPRVSVLYVAPFDLSPSFRCLTKPSQSPFSRVPKGQPLVLGVRVFASRSALGPRSCVRRFFSVRPTFNFLTLNLQPPPPFNPSKRPFNLEIQPFPVKHFTSSPIPCYPSPCSPHHPPHRRITPCASVRSIPIGVILSLAKDLLLSPFWSLSPLQSALP